MEKQTSWQIARSVGTLPSSKKPKFSPSYVEKRMEEIMFKRTIEKNTKSNAAIQSGDFLDFFVNFIRKVILAGFTCFCLLTIVWKPPDVHWSTAAVDEFQPPSPPTTTAKVFRMQDRPVTVVTAYYNVPSKRSNKTYIPWIRSFLRKIPCHLYIFTDKEHYSRLTHMRKDFENRTRIVVKPFHDLRMAQR